MSMLTGLVLAILTRLVALFDYSYHLYVSTLRPLLAVSRGRAAVSSLSLEKAPRHIAVAVRSGKQARAAVGCLGGVLGVEKITLISRHELGPLPALKGKTVCTYRRGAFMRAQFDHLRLLAHRTSKAELVMDDLQPLKRDEYDLVIDLNDVLSLEGLNPYLLGFAEIAHLPCPCSFLVQAQIGLALERYSSCRQNFGK